MRIVRSYFTSAIGLAIAMTACAPEDTSLSETDSEQLFSDQPESKVSTSWVEDGIDRIEGKLALGSRGERVRAINDYLQQYGYFPNPGLTRVHSSWRPLVAGSPRDPAVYDEQTGEAIRALQRNFHLPVTGIVDADTAAILEQPRCGFPDFAPASGSGGSSFAAAQNDFWFKKTVSWKVMNTDDGIPLNSVRAAAINAFARWQAETDLTFVEATWIGATPDIDIRFVPFNDPNDTAIANGAFPGAGGDIRINSWKTWGIDPNVPAGGFSVEQMLTHEVGHTLGLYHTSVDPLAVMMAGNAVRMTLRTDDKVAASVLYDTYTQVPGLAKDIGVGGSSSPAVWVIGTNPVGNADFGIFQFNGSGWDAADGCAVRIAVNQGGIPWVVNSVGTIYSRTTGSALTGAWQEHTGRLATDIAIGQSIPWIITKTPWGAADFTIAAGNGIGGWNDADGGAVRIAVGFDGRPWVVNSVGNIYRRTTDSPTSGEWELMSGLARDIGVGHSNMWDSPTEVNYPWVVGTNTVSSSGLPVSNGFGTFVLNQQPDGGDGFSPFRDSWIEPISSALTGAVAISVGPAAKPWIVGADGRIFRTK